MMNRAASIAREMIPSVDLCIKSALRSVAGIVIMHAAHLAPASMSNWLDLGGRMFVMLAVFGLFGHVEGAVAKHASAKIRIEATRLGWWLAGAAVSGLSFFTLWARNDDVEDENGLG